MEQIFIKLSQKWEIETDIFYKLTILQSNSSNKIISNKQWKCLFCIYIVGCNILWLDFDRSSPTWLPVSIQSDYIGIPNITVRKDHPPLLYKNVHCVHGIYTG